MTTQSFLQTSFGSFALYIQHPFWIHAKPATQSQISEIVWQSRGPCDINVYARRDGFIIFEFDKSEFYLSDNKKEFRYKRIRYMNAFLLAVYSSYSTIQRTTTLVQAPINPTNYFVCAVDNGEWKSYDSSSRQIFYSPDNRDVDYSDQRNILEVETLSNTIELMKKCKVAFGEEYTEVMTLIYIACHQYSQHQFSSAHLIAWAVVEKLINMIWNQLQNEVSKVNGGHTELTKKRKELLAGRDYTASVIIQILSINKKIDDNFLDLLNNARKKRNDFAHSLVPISADDAIKIILLATDLVSKQINFPVSSQLVLNFGYNF